MFATNNVRHERRCVKYTRHMEVRPRPRSTRDRPAKAPLSEEVILDVALRILRAEGLEAVTMRRVASELDTGPASLYVYIQGRDGLRTAIRDRVTARVKLNEPEPQRWREQVHALLGGLLTAMEEHPGIAGATVASAPTTPHTLLMAENLLGLLLAGGASPQDAAWACDVLSLITTASAVETEVWRSRGSPDTNRDNWVEHLRSTFSSLPPTQFPLITSMTHELTTGTGNERFHFAIDVFLDGMLARSEVAP
jgi:AcrR family transcriptional regulator